MNGTSRGALALTACLAAAWARGATSACSGTAFLEAPRFPTGVSPSAVAIADFNNDTFPDIVTVSDEFGVSVLLGDGSGGFAAPLTGAETIFGFSILAADFDGDGNADVAVGQYGTIFVLIGNGDGSFQPPVPYVLPSGSGATIYSMAITNIDANDTLDIVAAGQDGALWILFGNGDGSFGNPTGVPTNGNPGAVAAGDVNGDGKVDLVATTDRVVILLGNGDGTFGAPQFVDVGIRLGGIAIGDVDGDGKADLGVTVRPFGEVQEGFVGILLGNGDGTFQAAIDDFVGGDPYGLLLRDIDGDGFVDAVVNLNAPLNSFSDQIAVLHGNGTPRFASTATYLAGSRLHGPAAGDLDFDGQIDLVAVLPVSGEVSILFGNGSATLRSVVSLPSPLGVSRAAIGDFDSDGVADAVVTGYNTSVLAFYKGLGGARFGLPRVIPTPPTLTPVFVFAADLDGDGKLDLVVDGSQILLGNGDGTFRFGESIASGSEIAADVDGNGILDLVGTTGTGIGVALGNGDGTFGDPVITPRTEMNPYALAAGDFNGDGKADLAYYATPGLFQPTTIYVFDSNGDGTFTPTYSRESATGVGLGIAIRDVTGEGKADVLAAQGPDGLLLFRGHGDGTFDDPETIGSQYSESVFVADFDRDGVLDLVTTNANPVDALFFKGLGSGNFAFPVPVDNGGATGLAVAAVSGAGPDLVMIRSAFSPSAQLSFLLNARLSASVGNRSVIVGSAAVLEASASGYGAIAYQWRRNGVPLSDGGPISGAMTATLTISPVAFTDAGSYDVVVTDSCTNLTSNAATLAVEFDDVPLTNPFHNDILTIATAGITSGCTLTSFCPSNPVSRAEMAVFLLKAKDGADHVPPPPPPDPIFPDVPADAFAAAWIDELASLGVTGGCGGGLYCPDRSVSRAEMAVFLLKTLLGSGYTPPPPAGLFADVPADNFAIAWIEDLYNRGITAGCATNPLRFCPDANVPREQMATFLVRTFLP